jgi:hypothetical protein
MAITEVNGALATHAAMQQTVGKELGVVPAEPEPAATESAG